MLPIERLLAIVQTLRSPERGCPWDCQQTFDSIAPHTLEETYEVLDAIQREDIDDLRAELGDLLFQILFFAQIAKEQQQFDFYAVCDAISDKLVRRHPHIFNGGEATTPEQVADNWEKIKTTERAQKGQHSALDDIPLSLPALMRAQKIQQRCRHRGFDWQTVEPVLEKVHEEINEVIFEANQEIRDQQKLEEEVGDLLFATVNFARHLEVNAEMALQRASNKFERRFRQVEEIINTQGKTLSDATFEEMENAWQQVKSSE